MTFNGGIDEFALRVWREGASVGCSIEKERESDGCDDGAEQHDDDGQGSACFGLSVALGRRFHLVIMEEGRLNFEC